VNGRSGGREPVGARHPRNHRKEAAVHVAAMLALNVLRKDLHANFHRVRADAIDARQEGNEFAHEDWLSEG